MRKLFYSLLMAAGLFVACVTPEEFSDLHFDHAQTKAEVKTLQRQLEELKQDLAAEVTQITAIINALNTRVDGVEAYVSDEFDRVRGELTAAINELTQAIASGDASTMAAALAAVAEAEDDLTTALENHIDEVKLALEALGVADADLQSQIDRLIADLTALNATLNAEVMDLDKAIVQVNQLVADANYAIAANTASIDELRTMLEESIKTVNDAIAALGEELRQLVANTEAAILAAFNAAQAAQDAALAQGLSDLNTQIVEAVAALTAADAAEATAREAGDQATVDRIIQVRDNLRNRINNVRQNAEQFTTDSVSDAKDELEQAIADVQAAVDTNTTAIAGLQNAISALSSTTAAIDFVDNSELEARLATIISELQAYADNNDDDTVFDDTAILAEIQAITASIATNSPTWAQDNFEADTTLDAAAITQEIADAIATAVSGLATTTSSGAAYDDTELQNALQELRDRVNDLYNSICDWDGVDEAAVLQQSVDEEITETKTYTVEETSTECGITRNVEVEVTVTEATEATSGRDANGDGDMEDTIFIHQLSDGTRMERVVNYVPVVAPEFDTDMTAFLNTLSEDDTFEYDGRTIIYAGVSYQGKVWALESHANNNDPNYNYVYIVNGPNGIGLHDDSYVAFQNRNTGGTLTSAEAAAEVLGILFASRDLSDYLTNVRIAGTPSNGYAYAAAFDWARHQNELSNITVTSTLSDFNRVGTVVDFNAPNDIEQITFTFTSTDYEGSVTVTLDNPAYQMLITDKYQVGNGSAAHRRNIQPIQGSIQGARNGTFTVSPGASATWDGGGVYEVNIFFDTPLVESAEVTFIHPDYRGELVFTVANPNYDANWKPNINDVFVIQGPGSAAHYVQLGTQNGYNFGNPVDGYFNQNKADEVSISVSNGGSFLGFDTRGTSEIGFAFDDNSVEEITVTMTHVDLAGEFVFTVTNENYVPIPDVTAARLGAGADTSAFNTNNYGVFTHAETSAPFAGRIAQTYVTADGDRLIIQYNNNDNSWRTARFDDADGNTSHYTGSNGLSNLLHALGN